MLRWQTFEPLWCHVLKLRPIASIIIIINIIIITIMFIITITTTITTISVIILIIWFILMTNDFHYYFIVTITAIINNALNRIVITISTSIIIFCDTFNRLSIINIRLNIDFDGLSCFWNNIIYNRTITLVIVWVLTSKVIVIIIIILVVVYLCY